MMNTAIEKDKIRYGLGKPPKFLIYFRAYQHTNNVFLKFFWKFLFDISKKFRCIEISPKTKIGEGVYFGHPYCITINSNAVIGSNVNINKGVTIGKEERGRRKGTPTISDCVYIGINSTIVGNIHIGEDVLIAPNTFVNCDIPSHTIVIGNPCILKHKIDATEAYIINKV